MSGERLCAQHALKDTVYAHFRRLLEYITLLWHMLCAPAWDTYTVGHFFKGKSVPYINRLVREDVFLNRPAPEDQFS